MEKLADSEKARQALAHDLDKATSQVEALRRERDELTASLDSANQSAAQVQQLEQQLRDTRDKLGAAEAERDSLIEQAAEVSAPNTLGR